MDSCWTRIFECELRSTLSLFLGWRSHFEASYVAVRSANERPTAPHIHGVNGHVRGGDKLRHDP